jgi:hypothetical protein
MDTPKENTGEDTAPAAGNPPIAAESPANTTPAETVTADQLAAPLAENMPIPTATENAQTEIPAISEAVPSKPVPVIRDKSGKLFDPTKHAVDDLWQPRFNKNGFFVSKFIGNPGKKKDAANPDEQQPRTAATPTTESESFVSAGDGNTGMPAAFAPVSGQPDQYDRMADMYLETGYGIAAGFLGDGIRPEFKVEKVTTGGPGLPDQIEEVLKRTPEGKQEHESLRYPLAAALREKQVTGMTPTQMFLASLAAYVSRKAAKPTVRERFTLCVLKIRSWFKKAIPSKN